MKGPATFRRLVGAAADPGLAPGAADRIAEGAWARAAELRRDVPVRAGRLRRITWPIAVAAGVLVAVTLAVRSTTPAFAVEGDPVQVLDGDHWDSARRVRAGTWVFVPPGSRTIRSADGSQIDPQPGAVFRLVSATSPGAGWRVEMRSGDAEVAGNAFVLEISDRMEVSRAESGPIRLQVSLGDALRAPPARVDAVHARTMPTVRVLRGAARVANLRDAQFMLLRTDETVASVVVDDSHSSQPQIVRQVSWSPQVVLDVANGANLLNALPRSDGTLFVNIGARGGVWSVSIPPAQSDAALGQLTLVNATSTAHLAAETPAPVARATNGVWRQVEFELGGAHTRVTAREDGTILVERSDAEPRLYASAEVLALDAPDAAALLESLR